ncbi:alpha/beta hydrolase [Patescibacteria group bacterium]|nr:alpha/beta hydrolase [Patescibacteria group bacterium]
MFDHIYIDNKSPRTLVLLHGTGGNKSEFLFLDQALHQTYNLLSLQGNVTEQGMARFFKRTAPGVFDQENIKQEADKLKQFIEEWSEEHNQKISDFTFLGYSNGANMILATMFHYPNLIWEAVLLHPMKPFDPKAISLADHHIFMSSGEQDQMVSKSEQQTLTKLLEKLGSTLTTAYYPGGHALSNKEIADAVSFLLKFKN